MKRILTDADKKAAFLRATHSFTNAKKRWKERAEHGLTDEQLTKALKYELGIAGGSGCRDTVSVSYQGAGLKIWASWNISFNTTNKPIFEGKETIQMARIVFGIADPNNAQMSLF